MFVLYICLVRNEKKNGIVFSTGVVIIATVIACFAACWQAYEAHIQNHSQQEQKKG
jgi:hypothetical protein